MLTKTFAITDAYKYTVDGSGLDGTFTVGDGYITNCQSNVGLTSFGLNSDFEMSYKFYPPNPTGGYVQANSLWNMGANTNNGVLIGTEAENKRIRIYNRNNGTNTSIDLKTNCYNYDEWSTATIKYENGVWSITVNGNTLSYSKTFTPTSIHLNYNFPSVRLKEFMIKPL